jgi:hypothetical protein
MQDLNLTLAAENFPAAQEMPMSFVIYINSLKTHFMQPTFVQLIA